MSELENTETQGIKTGNWPDKEEDFHLNQVRNRSELRIRNGRAQPIDYFACYAGSISVPLESDQIPSIDMILKNINAEEIEDLLEDIKVYQRLENGKNEDYWNDVTVLVLETFDRIIEQNDPDRQHFMASKVEDLKDDIFLIFKGKSYEGLENLKTQINNRIRGQHDIDIDYWNTVLKYLASVMAKSRIDVKLEEYEKRVENAKLHQNDRHDVGGNEPPPPALEAEIIEEPEPIVVPIDENVLKYQEGNYSPVLRPFLDDGVVSISAEEYARSLVLEREFIREVREHERIYHAARGGKTPRHLVFEDQEADFSEIFTVDSKNDPKNRFKIARFFNKINTGYEFDHCGIGLYDTENPPPRIVIGYKFNIFYPDLIDKTKRPQYTLNVSKESTQFCTLTFCSGPPYSDISFQVVNREWNYNSREGFKCQYSKNIFQLWFTFKRQLISK